MLTVFQALCTILPMCYSIWSSWPPRGVGITPVLEMRKQVLRGSVICSVSQTSSRRSQVWTQVCPIPMPGSEASKLSRERQQLCFPPECLNISKPEDYHCKIWGRDAEKNIGRRILKLGTRWCKKECKSEVQDGEEFSSNFLVLFFNAFEKKSAGMFFKLDWGVEFQYLFVTS